ncbi:hypothetical protein Pve01_03390 [Planomonospora venezuelensis]|nr:hypothetical protein Pve01_03390 [Planomonospora venezuelensis]
MPIVPAATDIPRIPAERPWTTTITAGFGAQRGRWRAGTGPAAANRDARATEQSLVQVERLD